MKHVDQDLLSRPELRVVLAVAGTLALLVLLLLGVVRERTFLLYDDLGAWRIHAPGRELDAEFVDSLRPPEPQQPFRLELMLDRIPQAGDRIIAERVFEVKAPGPYCFETFFSSDYYNPDSASAIRTFRAGIVVNDEPALWRPIGDLQGVHSVRVAGIEPREGRIEIDFAVEAQITRHRPSWQRASSVRFEFARLYPCDDAQRSRLP